MARLGPSGTDEATSRVVDGGEGKNEKMMEGTGTYIAWTRETTAAGALADQIRLMFPRSNLSPSPPPAVPGFSSDTICTYPRYLLVVNCGNGVRLSPPRSLFNRAKDQARRRSARRSSRSWLFYFKTLMKSPDALLTSEYSLGHVSCASWTDEPYVSVVA